MNNVEELIAEYRNEAGIAASSFFAWKAINNIAVSDSVILQALNTNASSWKTITHSLLVTFYTALGRIFDEDNRSLTVLSFLGQCKHNIAQFSRSALEARRVKGAHGARPEWLDAYLQGAYEAVAADFDALADVAKKHKAIYESNYKTIRNKIISHKDLATIGSKDALFAKTNIGEIQEILQFLHQAGRVVAELHMNGRKTDLTDHEFKDEQYVRDDLANLLHKLPIL